MIKLMLQFFATKIMRYDVADYLEVTPVSGTAAYYLMGVGYTKLDESPSPKVNTDAYINSRNGNAVITGYENSFSYDTQMQTGASAETTAALIKVAHDQLTGADAEFNFVRVDLYAGATDGSYPARKFRVCAEVGDITGNGNDVMATSGKLHQIGDMIPGTFDVATKAFTATA